MKKILIFAVAVLAAVACSRTYEVKETASVPIGFGTWTETLTKARAQGSSTFADGDDFAVYGFKVNSGTISTVFDGIVVSYSNSDWTYSPSRFWDPDATSYTFYGVSPAATGTAATVNPQTGEITSASITFAGNDNDVLVADKKEVSPSGSPAAYSSDAVNIQFNHIASLVDFKVKKHSNLGNAAVTITSFSISNIDNTGTFGVSTAYTSNHPEVTWNASAHTGSYNNTSGVTSATLPTNVQTTGDLLINNLVAMPQTFRTTGENIQTVSINYTITDEANNVSTYSSQFNLATFDTTDDTSNDGTAVSGWVGGKHYTFFITIDANKIVFTASITDWTTSDATGYHYLIN